MHIKNLPIVQMLVDRNRVFINTHPHYAIVEHETAGFTTIEECAQYFATTPLEVSSHYIVGRDGRIAQCVLESDGAAANCCTENGYNPIWDNSGDSNKNFDTISIEHINPDVNNALPMTDIQKSMSWLLNADICDRKNIPYTMIYGHNSLLPVQRVNCPGPFFPINELRGFVMSALSLKNWTYDVKTQSFTTPYNSYVVQRGFAQYILNGPESWRDDNYPLENEVAYQGGTRQLFKQCMLVWDAQGGIKPGNIGDTIQHYEAIKSNLQNMLSEL